MSYFDYEQYRRISAQDPSFYALIMAAMKKADGENLRKLVAAWPEVYAELDARYNAPGGLLAGETDPRELRPPSPLADDR